MEPLGGITITAREIYDAVVRLTGRVDVLIVQHADLQQDLQQHEQRADARHADHETRLRSLERSRWPLPSVAALIGAAGLVLTIIKM